MRAPIIESFRLYCCLLHLNIPLPLVCFILEQLVPLETTNMDLMKGKSYPKNHQLKAAFLFYIIMNLIASGLFFKNQKYFMFVV